MLNRTGSVVKTPKKAVVRLTLAALFAALIAGGTFVAVPLPFSPVPIVLQNLFVVLAGLVLGPALGASAVALFLAAGALGLPVFAGASGGLAHFAGPTGGFLAGYLLAALAAGLAAGRPAAGAPLPFPRFAFAAALGLLAVYLPGVAWLSRFTGSWPRAFAAGVLPFLPGDAVKACIAAGAAGRLRRAAADQLNG